ncbi:MAG: hypothetical protein AB1567_07110 [bacterium]
MAEILKCAGAVYLGIEKEGDTWLGKLTGELTICGEGNLKLSTEGVTFKRWLPPREFFIPLKKIKRVELGTTHLLKPVFPGRVLRIVYQESEDTLIFGVWLGTRDGMKWKTKIESLLSEQSANVEKEEKKK